MAKKKLRKLVTAKSRRQAIAIGMSKGRKSGSKTGGIVGYEVHQQKRGKPSPRGIKRLAKKRKRK